MADLARDGLQLLRPYDARTVSSSLRRLVAPIVGDQHVLDDEATLGRLQLDWTGRFRGAAAALVRPGSARELAAVLGRCSAAGVGVVPMGGNTGLVGGAVAPPGTIVVSLGRLDGLSEPAPGAASLTAGAGVTISRVQAAAARAGRGFALDLGSRESATVGGAIATDAGGLRAVRHGSMAGQVEAVEAALPDGTVLDLDGHEAPVLRSLLAGSEGTLAVITAARLRLVTEPAERAAAWIGLPDVATAVAMGAALRDALAGLEALEVMTGPSVDLAAARLGTVSPVGAAAVHVLVEAGVEAGASPALAGTLASIGAERAKVAFAPDGPAGRRLWAIRDAMTDAVATLGVPHKLDVTVPPDAIPTLLERLSAAVAAIDSEAMVLTWGHLGVGGLHINIVGPPPEDEVVDTAVYRLVLELGGSPIGEHGIGRAKRRWREYSAAAEDLRIVDDCKAAVDPAGILNPGVLAAPGRSAT